MIEVIDSYLPGHEWKDLYERALTVPNPDNGIQTKLNLNWNYTPTIANRGDGSSSTGYFVHNLMIDEKKSEHFDIWMDPLFGRLQLDNYKVLHRAKINLYPRTHKIESHGYHVDLVDEQDVPIDHMNAVYYLNDCDGFTEFEDGSRIASRANRIVIFDGHMAHRSTTCTDQPARVSVNMNIMP